MEHEHQKNGQDERKFGVRSNWIVIAEFDTRLEAEFAVNGLRSYEIPAILDARPGVLGDAGLAMFSIYSGGRTKFRVLVPATHQDEAADVVKVFQISDEDNDPGDRQSSEDWPENDDDE
jgi:hypothetical protein